MSVFVTKNISTTCHMFPVIGSNNSQNNSFTFISMTVCKALVLVDSGAASYLLCSS